MEHQAPLVSVLVITYNSAKYVIETLESIQSQSYPNLELIIADDGSSDDSMVIANEWTGRNKDRFIHTHVIAGISNTGIPANCNRGLLHVRGVFIKLIAGDDLLLPTCIEDNVTFAEENNSVFTVSRMNELTESGLQPRINDLRQRKITEFIGSHDQLRSYIRNPVFLNSPTFFMKTSMLKEIGNFDESFALLEDQPMIIRMLRKGYRVRFLDKYTVTYRTHAGSVSYSENYNKMTRDLYNCLMKYRFPGRTRADFMTLVYLADDWLSYQKQLTPAKTAANYLFRILSRLSPLRFFNIDR